MKRIKKILLNGKIMLAIFVMILAVLAVAPSPHNEGAAIQNVLKDSPAHDAGIAVNPQDRPISRELIIELDGQPVRSAEEYYAIATTLEANQTVRVKTTATTYSLVNDPILGLGFSVVDAPTSNLRKGLDLSGGTRVFLQPVEEVDETVLDQIVDSLELRLNTFGLSDIVVRKVTSPDQYIIVEIAGATQEEVRDLISAQGKFEAKIANQSVFTGDEVKYVATSTAGQNVAYVEQCSGQSGFYQCSWRFNAVISEEAAQRFGEITRDVPLEGESLRDPLDLYLDDELISNLSISANLRGRSDVTNPSVSGASTGSTEALAFEAAQAEMKHLQTVLQSGSLPVALEIVNDYSISPSLGAEFLNNALLVGAVAILIVTIIVYIRYMRFAIAVPMALCMIWEVGLLLGLAAVVGWQLDLAAIAGIIIAAGTGVDDQIVIADELLRGKKRKEKKLGNINWSSKMKAAFFIIFAAYFSTVVAMLPLWFAGAGLLKGFAFVTIAGVSFGVLITRPAYAKLVELWMREE